MHQENMVIVGAGHSGARAAQALRANGWQERITIIDAEGRTPYERPPLSKAVLKGERAAEVAPLFPAGYLAENGIDFLSGIGATAIDRAGQRLALSDGNTLPYHRLLLATGAIPRDLGVPGRDASGIYPLRNAADAESIAQRLQPGVDIVIVGGGLIGLEAASAAISRGCNVTVVEAGPRLMMRAVPAPLSSKIRHHHESKGVRFLFGRRVVGFGQHAGGLNSVSLNDGTTLTCSASIISIGVLPRTELAERSGLTLDNGVAVNCFLQTSDPYIYAAGDASSFALGPGVRMRLECWKNAEDQGSVVARNMMGGCEPYLPFPWMWSDQFDQTMQIAGIADGAVDHVERQCEDGTLLIYHLDDAEKIQAVSGFGSIREVSRGVRAGQMLMERGLQPSRQALQDPNCDLRMFAKAVVA